MAVALVGTMGTAQLYTSGSAASTLAYGQTPTAGNLLVLWVSVTGSATLPTTPSGWTIAKQQAGTSCSASIYYKIAAGSDAAPTVAAITSGSIAGRLGEYTGQAATPLASTGGVAGTSSSLAATNAAADAASGALMVSSVGLFNSNARTNATWNEVYTNGTAIQVNNSGVSVVNHYGFSYAITTANAVADKDTFAFTTTQLTGAVVALASFNPTTIPVDTGAAVLAATAGMTVTPTLIEVTAPVLSASAGMSIAASITQLANVTLSSGASLFATTTKTAAPALMGGTGLVFGQAPPVTGYSAWFDASRLSGADGSVLRNWPDLSGQGNDQRGYIATTPTIYTTTPGKTVNGLPALWWDGEGSEFMYSVNNQNLLPQTMFVVGAPSSASDYETFWGCYPNRSGFVLTMNNGLVRVEDGLSGNVMGSSITPVVPLVATVMAATFDNATCTIYVNSSTPDSVTSTAYIMPPTSYPALVGGNAGFLCEVLAYPFVLSPAQITSVYTYLRNKWIGAPTDVGAAALSATAGLTVSGTITRLGTAPLAASAGMTVSASVKQLANVTLAGGAALNVSAIMTRLGVVAMAGSSIMAVTGIQTAFTPVALAASAAMAVKLKISQMVDNFNSGMLDPTMWGYDGNAPVMVNGRLTNTTSTAGGNWFDLYSVGNYDLTNSSFFIEFITDSNLPLISSIYITALSVAGPLEWEYDAIHGLSAITGNGVYRWSTPYNPVTHRWLRIRESSGTVYWDYSPNGVSWTNAFSLPDSDPDIVGIDLTNVWFYIDTEQDSLEASTTIAWDNLNVLPQVFQGAVAMSGIAGMAVSGQIGAILTEDSPALVVSNFGPFGGIGPGDIINAVTVNIVQYASSLGMSPPTYQLWDGTTAQIGATQNGSVVTTPTTDHITFTGVSYAQLATLQVHIYAHGPAGTTMYVDSVSLGINATSLPGVGAVFLTATAALNVASTLVTEVAQVPLSATAGMTLSVTGTQLANVVLAGGASLNVSALVTEVATVAMTATTTLTTAGTVVRLGTVPLAATAGLSITTGLVTEQASVAMTVTTGMAVSTSVVGVAALSGSTTLAIAAQVTQIASVVQSASASLVVTGVRTVLASVVLSGTATLTVAATIQTAGLVVMSATGGLLISTTGLATATVLEAATAGLTIGTASVTQVATVSFAGASNLTIAALVTELAAVALSGTAILTVAGVTIRLGITALSATAGLTITASVIEISTVAFSATAGLVVAGAITRFGVVPLVASTTLVITTTVTQVAAVILTSNTTLVISGFVKEFAAVAMSGTAILIVGATVKELASVAMSAHAGMTVVGVVIQVAFVTMSAFSNLAITGVTTEIAAIAFLTATAVLFSGTVQEIASIPLSATAQMTVYASTIHMRFVFRDLVRARAQLYPYPAVGATPETSG
jgi:hypothetical protein